MPEAFCGLETVRQKAQWTLCALWEKKMSFVRERTPHDNSPMFFFSQKNTEEQNTQRPTETLSQPISQNVTATEASPPLPHSFQEHVLPHSRTRPSPFENMPFYVQEHALLDAWQGPSLTQSATCWFHAGYRDRWNIHTEREFNIQRHNDIKTYNDRKNMLRLVFNVYRHNDTKTYNDKKNMLRRVFNGYRQNDRVT